MTKLDLVLERIRKLPDEEQEALAAEIEMRLDSVGSGSLLTDEQWAEVEAAMNADEPTRSHEDVFRPLRTARAAE